MCVFISTDCEDTESYLTLSPVTSDTSLHEAQKFTEERSIATDSGSLSSSLTEVTSVSSYLSDDFDSWCLAAKRSIPHNHNRWFAKFEATLLLDTRDSQEDEETEDDKRRLIIVHDER